MKIDLAMDSVALLPDGRLIEAVESPSVTSCHGCVLRKAPVCLSPVACTRHDRNDGRWVYLQLVKEAKHG